ncbi:MAG: glycosyltransferase family 2 protein [Gemmatimonadota bacterium]|nr:glycosyltransferase family 2 protein [Gemmatimonadota bacterium]
MHAFVDRLIDLLPGFTLRLGSDIPRVADAINAQLTLDDDALRTVAIPDNSTTRPVVSVVIPVFNAAHLIAGAVKSVLAQHWGAVEIIVVDDGSSDNIESAVQALPVDVLFIRQANAGPAAARNRGVASASGQFVAFLDADDLWTSDHLEALYEPFVADASLDVAHGLAQVTTLDNEGAGEYLGNPRESFPFYIGAGLYRREAFERIGMFDAELRFGEDTDWFQRARNGCLNIRRLEEVTLFVRRHAENSTRGKTLVELNALRVLKKHLDRQRSAGTSASSAS